MAKKREGQKPHKNNSRKFSEKRGYGSGTSKPVSEWRRPRGSEGDGGSSSSTGSGKGKSKRP